MEDLPRLESRLRWYVNSSWRSARPGAGTDSRPPHVDPDDEPLRPSTSEKLAASEAEQTLALLENLALKGCSPPRRSSPPESRDDEASVGPTAPGAVGSDPTAKLFPHHVRYMASAARAGVGKCYFYLEQASEAGSRLADVEMGLHLLYGWGCPRDVPKALAMLDGGIRSSHPAAMLAVSQCLRDGDGVPADIRAAFAWRQRAAALEFAPAQHALAEWLEEGVPADASGVSVPRDLVGAMHWYKRAAHAGYPAAQLNLAKLYLLGLMVNGTEGAAAQPPREVLDDTKAKAMNWLQRAASNGSAEARQLLAQLQAGAGGEAVRKRTPPTSTASRTTGASAAAATAQ